MKKFVDMRRRIYEDVYEDNIVLGTCTAIFGPLLSSFFFQKITKKNKNG